jgi:hypothetical protein
MRAGHQASSGSGGFTISWSRMPPSTSVAIT